jgi:hypothetical protein
MVRVTAVRRGAASRPNWTPFTADGYVLIFQHKLNLQFAGKLPQFARICRQISANLEVQAARPLGAGKLAIRKFKIA